MRRKRVNTDVLIDVTSLLDVVFILLLVIITQFQNADAKAAEQEALAVEAEQQANHEYDIYHDQVDSLSNVNQYIEFISVVSTFNPQTLSERTIDVHFSAEDSRKTINLDGRNVDDKYQELETMIKDYKDNNPEKLIVLSLNEDSEEILYVDEKAIHGIFTNLLDENVRIKTKE